jgi:hypothetical protein
MTGVELSNEHNLGWGSRTPKLTTQCFRFEMLAKVVAARQFLRLQATSQTPAD